MPKYFLGTIVLIFILAGCNHAWRGKVQQDFFLRLEQKPCRGTCQVYRMEVNAQGGVSYQGIAGVEKMGGWSKQLPSKSLKSMSRAIDESGFWKLRSTYGDSSAYLPATILSITHGGESHQVTAHNGAPVALRQLEARLITLIGEDGFTKE